MKKKPDSRRSKWYRQRKKWGFDDRDTWSLDMTTSQFILPRLKRFKELTVGCPGCFCKEHEDVEVGMKRWYKILDDMIYFHEINADDKMWYSPEVDRKRFERGLKYFGKHYMALWW